MKRDAALDGLRGFAVLAVLYAHLVVHTGLLPYHPLGGMGVLIFFVLSGYLIARICWRANPTVAAYAQFLRRRIVRLAPVNLALVLIASPVFSAYGIPTRDVLTDGAYALTQITAFVAAGRDVVQGFGPTWSLTVEWSFYLTFPLMLILVRRRVSTSPRRAAVFAALLALLLYTFGLTLDFRSFYLLPVANYSVMLVGAALSLWHIDHHVGDTGTKVDPARHIVAFGLLFAFVFLPGHTLGWGYKLSVLPATALATAVVIHGCYQDSLVRNFLNSRVLGELGLRAYSIYLWHVPVLWTAWVALPELANYQRALAGLLALVPVVYLSYRFLEAPVLLRGSSGGFSPRPRSKVVTSR